jgi:hypothetical protein
VGSPANGGSSVDGVPEGKTVLLVSGLAATTLDTIKVKVGKSERTSTPRMEMHPSERYKLAVSPDGSVIVSTIKL